MVITSDRRTNESLRFQEDRSAMSQTLIISDSLYHYLENTARQRGLSSIEQLLECWQAQETDLNQRRQAVRIIDSTRAKLFATYGEMPDSTALIREDRER
jgi:hypothetical protein